MGPHVTHTCHGRYATIGNGVASLCDTLEMAEDKLYSRNPNK